MKPSETAKSIIPDGIKGVCPPCLLERPGGSIPLPPVFQIAELADHAAREAYVSGDYRRAAQKFFSVAAALRIPAEGPYAESFTVNRGLSYSNAAIALAMANASEEACHKLREVAAADPACAEEIERILIGLLGGVAEQGRTFTGLPSEEQITDV